jgi:uncharacterized protein YodC (DUF2158 family)
LALEETMADFQPGDVVKLKSGGPSMTVSNVDDYGPTGPTNGALCVWFEQVKGVQTAFDKVFDVAVLEPVKPQSTGSLRVTRS